MLPHPRIVDLQGAIHRKQKRQIGLSRSSVVLDQQHAHAANVRQIRLTVSGLPQAIHAPLVNRTRLREHKGIDVRSDN